MPVQANGLEGQRAQRRRTAAVRSEERGERDEPTKYVHAVQPGQREERRSEQLAAWADAARQQTRVFAPLPHEEHGAQRDRRDKRAPARAAAARTSPTRG